MSIKAFGYLRVSGKDQVDGDGFPRQREAITAYAKAHGFRIVQWFEEKAQKGTTEWEARPAWLEMISAMNGVSTIFVEKLDRLARDLMVQEHIIADLRRRHVDLISAAAAEADLCVDDPGRKLLRQIMGAIAEYDRAMITAKLSGARKRMKAATGRCEGRKPFGDRAGEADAIELMQRRRSSGESYDAIAVALNDAGFATRQGKPWIGATVCKILKRSEV
jgi:DNA invertase Pin-like site-specific DNA recombinase